MRREAPIPPDVLPWRGDMEKILALIDPKSPDIRLVRSILPAQLVREVDELVLSGIGGYTTREEFIREAIQNHVLEVKHGVASGDQAHLGSEFEPHPLSPSSSRSSLERLASENGSEHESGSEPVSPATPELPGALADASELPPIDDLSETAISPLANVSTIPDGLARIREEPMLGLHNRDYPSIWATRLLAERTQAGPIPVQQFFAEAIREGWRYGYRLLPLDERVEGKPSALFPTNVTKAHAAEQGFQSFAIGDVARRPNEDGTINASGPLFLWGVCQLTREGGNVLVGLTESGRELLESCVGLTLAWPRDRQHAERFLGFLRARAPWDWAGFATLLDAVGEKLTREELVRRFQSWHPDWTGTKANTNTAGYVARGREWGLLEPKLIEQRYVITDLGDQVRSEASS